MALLHPNQELLCDKTSNPLFSKHGSNCFLFCLGIISETCWDGVIGVDYIGTSTITQTGYTCQAWMSDTPHTHSTDQLSYFPHDQETGPSNYCRDPGGWSTVGPWCYTMNPSVLWETCDIAICTSKFTPYPTLPCYFFQCYNRIHRKRRAFFTVLTRKCHGKNFDLGLHHDG